MYRREQKWLEKQVFTSSQVNSDYDRREVVPLRDPAGSGGPVEQFLAAFPAEEVSQLRTLDLTGKASGATNGGAGQRDYTRRGGVAPPKPPLRSDAASFPVGRHRADVADAAAVTPCTMLGEECANLVEFVQDQHRAGRLSIESIDISGVSMDRVAFLVLRRFVSESNIRCLIARNSRLTSTQFSALLDSLRDVPLETLDVSGCAASALSVRSLAEFIGHCATLRHLVCDGMEFPTEDARHFVRGLLHNESIQSLYMSALRPALGELTTETELLFRSLRHHKSLTCFGVADNGLSAAQLQPLMQAICLKKGFERVDLSHNLEGLSDPTFADEILKVLRFNESVSHIGLEGIEDTGIDPGVVAQLRKHVGARHALLSGENTQVRRRGAPLLLEDRSETMSSPHTRLEELARKQQGVQETDSLWRRHVAQSKLQLDATNAAVQNAQHDNQLVEHATEETLAEQKAIVDECSKLQESTAQLGRSYNEIRSKTHALEQQLKRELNRHEQLRTRFRTECNTLEYAQQVRDKLVADQEHLTEKLKAQRVFLLGQQKLLQALTDGNSAMAKNVSAADAVVHAAVASEGRAASGAASGQEDLRADVEALSGHPLEYFENIIASGAAGNPLDNSETMVAGAGRLAGAVGEGTSLEWELLTDEGSASEATAS